MKNKNRILLNWMPPALMNMPSPAMSVLKKALTNKGFNVNIIYWNILVESLVKDFYTNENLFEKDEVPLFILLGNYLSKILNDNDTYNNIKIYLKAETPQYTNLGVDYYDNLMDESANKLDVLVKKTISNLNYENVSLIGMSMTLYQWFFSSIAAKEFKVQCPDIPIVIGGIGTKKQALAFLENFPQFDYALWGEGEVSLTMLSQQISNKMLDINKIPNCVYRTDDRIEVSKQTNGIFTDLSSKSNRPDFSDYFRQSSNNDIQFKLAIPIEGSRGCHWGKCHFCYLNMGYKFRVKSPSIIIDELEQYINEYKVFDFQFIDNDIIGKDLCRFNELLNALIILKSQYPQFRIILAEIITQGVNSKMIQKMHLAGFVDVQIGYEAASDNLLKKIHKKNTFSSNLFFIKFALLYGIKVSGNIIVNLLEETNEDILESINNLHYLRFFLGKNTFKHSYSKLGVSQASRYCKKIEKEKTQWVEEQDVSFFLPKKYIKNNTDFVIIEGFKLYRNKLWDKFEQAEKSYLINNYRYEVNFINEEYILYKEYYNNVIIKELKFEEKSIHWFILKSCNDEVISLDKLLKNKTNSNKDTIIKALLELKEEYLVYTSDDYMEITSVINIPKENSNTMEQIPQVEM